MGKRTSLGGFIVVFLMIAEQVTSQSSNRTNTQLRRYCRTYSASKREVFLRNLNTTLSGLRRQLSNPQVYYAVGSTATDNEFVYAFAMCREYLSTLQCLACFDSAVNDTKACGFADCGNVIYDDCTHCSIRYENFGGNFNDLETILDDEALPGAVCGNESASQPVTTFNQTVQQLLSDIRDATPRTSNFYVASTRQVSTSNAIIYAVAQCIENTSQAICHNCLNTASQNLGACLPNREGRAIAFLCFMRYSQTPFFQSNQTTNIIGFLREGSSSKSGMIAGVSSGVGVFLLILVLGLWYRLWKKSKAIKEGDMLDESELQGAKIYSYQELQLATHNFGEEYRVGKGGFGEVFKATLDKESVVAVKKLHVGYSSAKLEFDNEVQLISNVRHRNLTRLLGWCREGPELLLVLEYMPEGSLDKYLWGEKRGTLNWEKRSNIIFGVARGLAHLHEEFHVKIIHRDIKPNNILLDYDFQPKIADFGLARFLPDDQTHVSTQFAGTLGYIAPEYATRGHLSEKFDVYSFGIAALEIISGRRCTDENFSGPDTTYLLEHAWQLYEKDMHINLIEETLDPNGYEEENVLKIIEVALMCTRSLASLRPTMSEVVLMLSGGRSFCRGQLIKPSFAYFHRRIHIAAK